MENSLQVLINFNEKIIRTQLEKYFYYSWKKKLPSLVKTFFFILLFLFAFDSLVGNKNTIDFFKFSGILFCLFSLICIVLFYYNKANYSIKTDKYIAEAEGYNSVTELYFDEKSFYIKSEQFDIRSIWKKISYEILDKTILIHIDMGSPFTYLVNEEETHQYSNILKFLKDKSKLKK